MLELKSKLPSAGTTIFTVMSRMAAEHGAINLSQGFPDFDGPQALRDRLTWHLNHGHNQYAPLAGVPELRQQIAAKIDACYGRAVNPDTDITITPGATEAIFCAVTAVLHPGDEVIVFDPCYDTYEPSVTLNGGVTRHVSTRYPDFRIDWDEVAALINERTRMIMLNSPQNPCGKVWDEADIAGLRRVIEGRNIWLLADEVYEHMVFDGQSHRSLLRYPDLAERTFAVFSFGKTFHATGWRVGYCIAPAAMTAEFLRIHQFINFSTNTPMQYALADFLRDEPGFHQTLAGFFQRKRDLFGSLMQGSRFRLKPAPGTYFQLADYRAISDEPDTEFAARLTREHGVAVIPVSVFYASPPRQQVVRFCFAKGDDTLRQAAERLAAI